MITLDTDRYPVVEFWADPRISSEMPRWLRGEEHRDLLAAMTYSDVRWIESQWELTR